MARLFLLSAHTFLNALPKYFSTADTEGLWKVKMEFKKDKCFLHVLCAVTEFMP